MDEAVIFSQVQFSHWLFRTLLTVALPLLLLVTGLAGRWGRQLERGTGRHWWLALLVAGALYGLASGLLQLPLDRMQLKSHAPFLDQEVPALSAWLPTQYGALLRSVLFWAAGALAVGALLHYRPRSGWLWAGGAASLVTLIYLAVVPMNAAIRSGDYERLRDPQWEPRLAAIADKAGFSNVPVFVRKTREGDYCRISNDALGMGPKRAIVLADQIFTRWTPEMIEAAYAHELKHYGLDNTWKAALLAVALCFGGAALVQAVMIAGTTRFAPRTRITNIAAAGAVPLAALGLQLFALLQPPVFNRISQQVEFEADRFSLELTHHNEARARIAADMCGNLWLPEETLFRQLYFNNHPDMATRVRFASAYRPWESGDPLKYAKYLQ